MPIGPDVPPCFCAGVTTGGPLAPLPEDRRSITETIVVIDYVLCTLCRWYQLKHPFDTLALYQRLVFHMVFHTMLGHSDASSLLSIVIRIPI